MKVVGILFLACFFLPHSNAKVGYSKSILNNIYQYIWQGSPPTQILHNNVERGLEVLVFVTKGSSLAKMKYQTLYWYEVLIRGRREDNIECMVEVNSVNYYGTYNEPQIWAYEDCGCGTIIQKETQLKSTYMFQWSCGISGVYTYYEDDCTTSQGGYISVDFDTYNNRDDLCRAIRTFELSGLCLEKDHSLGSGDYYLDFDYANCRGDVYDETCYQDDNYYDGMRKELHYDSDNSHDSNNDAYGSSGDSYKNSDNYHDNRDNYHDNSDNYHDSSDDSSDCSDDSYDSSDDYNDSSDDSSDCSDDSYDSSDDYHDTRDDYHDARDGYHDARDGYRDARDGYHDARDGYRDARDGYHDARDDTHDCNDDGSSRYPNDFDH